ncbi:MAG: hypothetical protein AAF322_19015 [Pseudomonadota bacterium]
MMKTIDTEAGGNAPVSGPESGALTLSAGGVAATLIPDAPAVADLSNLVFAPNLAEAVSRVPRKRRLAAPEGDETGVE